MAMAMSARCSTARRMEVCRGAVSLPRSLSFRQSWRSAPPLRWFGPYISTIATESGCADVADSTSGPRPGGPHHRERRRPRNPRRAIARTAPSRGTSNAGVPTTRTTSAPTNQPTARPSSERAGTTALTTRWIGTKASSSVHHHRRHRAGSHGPDTVSTAASIAIQRGSSRNCDEHGVEPVGQGEVPSRRCDAVAGDRQRENGDEPGCRVRAEQLPLPADDQADQDHERQRQNRDAVDQVDQVGLGGWQDADDFGDGFLERDPLARVISEPRSRSRGTPPRGRAAGCRWSVGSVVAASCRKR